MKTEFDFKEELSKHLQVPVNEYHPLVFIHGKPIIGEGTYIGLFSEINANKAKVVLGKNCDIASFVSINCADSHLKSVGLEDQIIRKDIVFEDNVFVGSHSFIGGGVHIGHHSVIAAGTIITSELRVPPYSLIIGNPYVVKEGYYLNEI